MGTPRRSWCSVPRRAVTKASYRITHELLGQLTKAGKVWTADTVPAKLLGEIVAAVENGQVTGTVGRAVLKHIVVSPTRSARTFQQVLGDLGLSSAPSSADDLRATCEAVIAKLPKEADKVRKGNQKVVMRLVGEVMKMSKGAADAKRAQQLFVELLK